MHRKRIAQLVILFFSSQFCIAQSISPKGSFVQSETKIGEEILFSLTVRYDKNLNVLFPDSTYSFGSFEYNSRTYFPTKTDSLHSIDSVVYKLSTFEIDSTQYLQLPVYVLKGKDSLIFFSPVDSIVLVQVVKEIPEKPEMKANTDLVNVRKAFNYPYLIFALVIVLILASMVVLFFGKRILLALKVYRMQKVHKKFIAKFSNMMRDVSGNNPDTNHEKVLAYWKNYMEKLEKKPISKLTTKEILVLHNEESLKDNLRQIDRSIYGGEKSNDLFGSFDYLMKFSVEIYNQKIAAIKNG